MRLICHDLFNISGRLKAIDAHYALYRNDEKERFEVFWRGKFTFVVPFDRLDERTVWYTKKTRRENADALEREIDAGNAAVWKERERKMQQLKNEIKDYVRYEFERFN